MSLKEPMVEFGVQNLFIVGLPRSGTSTLVHALRSVGYGGFAEGHLIGLLPVIEESIVRYYETWKDDNIPGTMLNAMDMNEMILRQRVFFRETFEKLVGPSPWLDKNATPFIMPYLEIIQSIWSDACFIYTKRRPVDFIASALKKFPNRTFENLCEALNFTASAWEVQKSFLNKYTEIDQSEFYEPKKLADKLMDFLYLDSKYKATLIENLSLQVERTSESYAPRSLSDLALTSEQIEYFNNKCGALCVEHVVD